MTLAQAQQGATLTVNGSHFVSSSQIVINSTALAANVVSANQLTIKLGADVISGPGSVKIKVHTPSGNSGDLGCSSGGDSSVLVLTID
jgi:heme-binding NEAT domain protein